MRRYLVHGPGLWRRGRGGAGSRGEELIGRRAGREGRGSWVGRDEVPMQGRKGEVGCCLSGGLKIGGSV